MNKFNTIAIDLAKNVFQVCILSPDRTVIQAVLSDIHYIYQGNISQA
ncbi:hypothetical protein [Marinomonas mediterranea]|nr:hypothetical protein [Marinomonas mediterranea]WCN10080.1 hypothetical protein GV055_14735 [Marinomonas mediterranea]